MRETRGVVEARGEFKNIAHLLPSREASPESFAKTARTEPSPLMRASKQSPGRTGTIGPSAPESTTKRDVRVDNAITLYTALLDASSDDGALGTVVHEMGHALGLRHRNDPRSIMHATTGDETDPRPDAIDFWNLAVLYGERTAGARPGS